jgi:hypothetical protein
MRGSYTTAVASEKVDHVDCCVDRVDWFDQPLPHVDREVDHHSTQALPLLLLQVLLLLLHVVLLLAV